tara:strand:+ start:181 stop:543 length:363 start_codon:yes stop_codon:yes gene_type:complete
MKQFKLEIISPNEIVFEKDVDLVIFPGSEGDIGILKDHMPFLTSLRVGIVYIYLEKKIIETFLVTGGIVEVSQNRCSLLTEEVINTNSVNSTNKTEESSNKNEVNLESLKNKALEKLYYS